MNESKEKAAELIERFEKIIYQTMTDTGNGVEAANLAKQCAIICCENEYKALRGQLKVICMLISVEVSNVQKALNDLTEQENQVKSEIEKY